MKHLGSVTDVHGGDIEPVDIITFGSPCQDLSVAGKRAGLKHEANGDDETTRSGLFMEAVRIIKEMREATNGEYPTFAVWENVPGAFSSNKGEDFRTVLEELIKIVEPTAVMPAVPKNGWPYADSYCGDGWSLAYRVFDAQYWGVPQRRRRIYLVLDLRGQRAGKVSFEREGVRGNFATFKTAGQGTAGDAANRTGADDCERECVTHTFQNTGQGWWNESGVGTTLRTPCGGDSTLANVVVQTVDGNILDDQGGQQITVRTDGKAPTLRAETHGNVPCVMESAGFNYLQGSKARTIGFEMEKAGTLRAGQFGDAVLVKMEVEGFDMYNQQSTGDKSRTLKTPIGGDDLPVVCYSVENHPADSRVNIDDSGKVQTLAAEAGGNSVPSVCVKCYDARGNGDGQTVSTLTGDHENRITDYTSVVCDPIPIHDKATRYKGGGPTRNGDGAGNGLGVGKSGDPCPTLSTCDHHMVCYCEPAVAFKTYQKVTGPLMANSHPGSYTGQDAFSDMLVAGVDCRNGTEYPEMTGTLQAKSNGGFSLNCNQVVRVQYIVRRLTPTECARLQGFPDAWGHPDHKEDFTDEEYRFWLNVRNTHAAINGKPQKDYTKAQMLTWYNKLHTDSSEYKMWGNGISLPTALYVMQGIAEALKGGEG